MIIISIAMIMIMEIRVLMRKVARGGDREALIDPHLRLIKYPPMRQSISEKWLYKPFVSLCVHYDE